MNKEKKGATAPATSFGPQKPRFISDDIWRLARPVEREVLSAFTTKKAQIRLANVQTKATKRTVQLALANLVEAKILVRVERGLYGVA